MDGEVIKKEIFIVHGRNNDVKIMVSEFLVEFRLIPIILNEQANEGMTVIEKFEKHSDVGYAVVLMTDDDLGKEKSDKEFRARARQNVILELGYFMAKERSRVCILYSSGVELPTDLGGIVYVEIDKENKWKEGLEKELGKAGYDNIFSILKISNRNLMLNTNLRPFNKCRISAIGPENEKQSISIEGDFGSDYVDIFFDAHGERLTQVEYTFADFKDFLFYVHVGCYDSITGNNAWRWISLKNEIFTISKNVGELEKAYPVKSKSVDNELKKISTNIAKVFDELYGQEGLKYSNIERMRIRGSGKLLEIVLR